MNPIAAIIFADDAPPVPALLNDLNNHPLIEKVIVLSRPVAAAAATGAANGMDVDNVARTPERAAGKKAAAGVGGASVGKRRVVDSDDSD